MNSFNYITLEDLYAKVSDDLSLEPKHRRKVLNFIGECTEGMVTTSLLVPYKVILEVKDYIAKLPCNVVNLVGCYKNKIRVNYNSKLKTSNGISHRNRYFVTGNNIDVNIYSNDVIKELMSLEQICECGNETYNKRGLFLHFSFSKGKVELFYETLMKDDDDNLLYPDNFSYKEAVVNWVNYKCIIAGILKGNLEVSLQLYNRFKNIAMNEIEFPSIEFAQQLVNDRGIFKDLNY